jgi:hypothetical protein
MTEFSPSTGYHLTDDPGRTAISFIADAKQFALEGAAPVHPARVRSAGGGDAYRRDR